MVKVKTLFARAVKSELFGRLIGWAFHNRIPASGLKIETRNVHPSINGSLLFRTYERAEIKFIKRYLRRDLDVIELGANIGVVSSHIAKVCKSSRLVCVEANPDVINTLEGNLSRNAGHLIYSIENAVLDYSENDSVAFYIGKANLASSVARITDKRCDLSSISLSQILSKHNIKRYCLVMDIEGTEIDLVLFDRTALGGCQQIIAELHDAQSVITQQMYTVDQIISLICDCGFVLSRRRGPVCVFTRAD